MHGLFYKNDEQLKKGICKLLSPLKTRGMSENNIERGLRIAPFISAYKECNEHTNPEDKGLNSLIKEIRRISMWKVILKYINDGFTTSEIAKSLDLPYSTVYYYRKKFKARKKPRESRQQVKLDENGNIITIPEPYKERKARLEHRKTAMAAAEEKRKRRAEKLLENANINKKEKP